MAYNPYFHTPSPGYGLPNASRSQPASRPIVNKPKLAKNFKKKHTPQPKGIVPASIIRRRAKGDGVVEEYVYDILKVVEDDIEKAMEEGKPESRTELQTEFNIPPLPRIKAQKRVYYYLLKEIEMGEYRPQIEIVGDKSGMQRAYLYVRWLTEHDEDEETYMDKYIKSHSRINDTNRRKDIGRSRRRRR